MSRGVLIFLAVLAVVIGGALIVYEDSKRPLPKNLPPPIKDENEDR